MNSLQTVEIEDPTPSIANSEALSLTTSISLIADNYADDSDDSINDEKENLGEAVDTHLEVKDKEDNMFFFTKDTAGDKVLFL